MTMDVYQRTIVRADSSPPIDVDGFREIPPSTPPPNLLQQPLISVVKKSQKPVKRSFDVAFLMAPDDLSKKRENKTEIKKPYLSHKYLLSEPDPDAFNSEYQLNPLSLTIRTDRLSREAVSPLQKPNQFLVRSAFTKVSNSNFQLDSNILRRTPPIAISPSSVSSNASNRSGLSPDLTYQDSLSPQPFVAASRSPVQLLPTTGSKPHYQNPLIPSTNFQYFVTSQLNNPLLKDLRPPDEKSFALEQENFKPTNCKPVIANPKPNNYPYPSDNLSIPYPAFPMTTFPFTPTLASVATAPVSIFPTAALLPSSLAAFTLPAQNVCAKCNMHFRMTSDLVYHMRSHHKNENVPVDPYKRRRDQDKLKCPVCNESFRERHHLTRHMTAHQDKGDEGKNKEFSDITVQQSTPTSIPGSAK